MGEAEEGKPAPSTVTRRFFYHANAMHCLVSNDADPFAIASRAAQAGMLHTLARGADRDEVCGQISRITCTFANYTVREFALDRLLHPRYRPIVSLDVIEPLLADASDFVRLMLWRSANGWPALANMLIRHRVPFPGAKVEIPERQDVTMVRCDQLEEWTIALRHVGATRRALHARNTFLGGRGPAAVGGGLYLPVDVWREIFDFVLCA